MNYEIIYASSRSHVDMWSPPSLFNSNLGSEFIFSTSVDDSNPTVILELDNRLFDLCDDGVILDIYNRNLISCSQRVIGMEIRSSSNLYEWRSHHITLTDNFIFENIPLPIKLNKCEKYLMISRAGGFNHFHIGQILLNKNCQFYELIKYDLGFYNFSKRFSMLSNSQVFQDIFALYNCGFSNNYFLEFGANDGVSLSNTILLESLGWNGIIGEALNRLYLAAKNNRRCIVVEGALGCHSGLELEFYDQNLISSAVRYADRDMHSEKRLSGLKTKVQTTRIDEVLKKHNAPNHIGFFSLDVEGAETEVLETFPFSDYFVACAAIEHNHTNEEKSIDHIMFENGFKRVLTDFSEHDGFYVNKMHVSPDWSQSEFLHKKSNSHEENLLRNIDKIFGL